MSNITEIHIGDHVLRYEEPDCGLAEVYLDDVFLGRENEDLTRLREELKDWQESAQRATGEMCGDEKHCACVPLLRKMLKDSEARVVELEKDKGRLDWLEQRDTAMDVEDEIAQLTERAEEFQTLAQMNQSEIARLTGELDEIRRVTTITEGESLPVYIKNLEAYRDELEEENRELGKSQEQDGEIERFKELIGFANRRADAAEARVVEVEKDKARLLAILNEGICQDDTGELVVVWTQTELDIARERAKKLHKDLAAIDAAKEDK